MSSKLFALLSALAVLGWVMVSSPKPSPVLQAPERKSLAPTVHAQAIVPRREPAANLVKAEVQKTKEIEPSQSENVEIAEQTEIEKDVQQAFDSAPIAQKIDMINEAYAREQLPPLTDEEIEIFHQVFMEGSGDVSLNEVTPDTVAEENLEQP